MYSTQLRIKWFRDSLKNSFFEPQDSFALQQEIHHVPDSVRKSLRLGKHRIRPSLSHKHRPNNIKNIDQLSKKIDEQLNANINICRFLNQEPQIQSEKQTMNILPTRSNQQYLTTADRMQSIRRRLSPVKRPKFQNRIASSVDSSREAPAQRITFLNIQKLQLIKLYSQAERKVDSTLGTQTLEQRYNLVPSVLIRQKLQKELDQQSMNQKQLKDFVINLKKTMKQGNSMKWTTKVRTKPFIAPFQRYYYKDFIWKVAFSNGLLLSNLSQQTKVKVYVGKGNNSQLIRSIIKRRSWWTFTQKYQEANFVWTQLKINNYFDLQQTSESQKKQKLNHLERNIQQQNYSNLNIMNQNDVSIWSKYLKENRNLQEKLSEDMMKRNLAFKKMGLTQVNLKNVKIQNHLSQNFVIGNKKALLYTMRNYYENIGMDVFDYLPLSFHIVKGTEDQEYSRFLSYFYQRKKKTKKQGTNNVWIVKPGELTNRGNGIIVCLTLDQIKNILKKGGKHHDGSTKTFILQQYIQKPFLYQKRKFDIRHYMLITSTNGHFKGYWFKRGYIRTSSAQYTLQHGQASVHLTNDAVQKWLPDYGKYQKGNKISYQDFQAYLDKQDANKHNFFRQIYPQMKKIAADVMRACAKTIDPRNLQHNFELFGMDFMIDCNFEPWLIEINSNPCLQLSCPLLTNIIPDLVQNTLKICVDSIIGPPTNFTQKRPRFNDNCLASNEFQLVYDSIVDQIEYINPTNLCAKLNLQQLDREQDEQFQDDGIALQD